MRKSLIFAVVSTSIASMAWAAPVDPQIPIATRVNVRVKRAYWFKWVLFQPSGPADTAEVLSEQMDLAGPKRRMRMKKLKHNLGSISSLNASDFSQQMWVEVYRYKPATSCTGQYVQVDDQGGNSWVARADMPTARYSLIAAAVNGSSVGDEGASSIPSPSRRLSCAGLRGRNDVPRRFK